MKTWQYVGFVGIGLILLAILLAAIPATKHLVLGVGAILAWIWWLVAGLLVTVVIFCAAGVIGGLFYLLVGWVDSELERETPIGNLGHLGIGIVFGALVGLLQALMMPVLMGWNTWVRTLAVEFGWPGTYEVLPLWWGLYGLAAFFIVYMLIATHKSGDW